MVLWSIDSPHFSQLQNKAPANYFRGLWPRGQVDYSDPFLIHFYPHGATPSVICVDEVSFRTLCSVPSDKSMQQ